MGCDGAGLPGPRRPWAAEAAGTFVDIGFLMVPTTAAEPGNFLDVTVKGVGPVGLAAVPDRVAEGHGLLGMVPLKPEGSFLLAGLAPAMLAKEGSFFGTRFLGKGCLPIKEPGGAVFFCAVAAVPTLSSTLLSSLMAAKQNQIH